LLLGHASVQTTGRYPATTQDLVHARLMTPLSHEQRCRVRPGDFIRNPHTNSPLVLRRADSPIEAPFHPLMTDTAYTIKGFRSLVTSRCGALRGNPTCRASRCASNLLLRKHSGAIACHRTTFTASTDPVWRRAHRSLWAGRSSWAHRSLRASGSRRPRRALRANRSGRSSRSSRSRQLRGGL
jgi:hypothetical protein